MLLTVLKMRILAFLFLSIFIHKQTLRIIPAIAIQLDLNETDFLANVILCSG